MSEQKNERLISTNKVKKLLEKHGTLRYEHFNVYKYGDNDNFVCDLRVLSCDFWEISSAARDLILHGQEVKIKYYMDEMVYAIELDLMGVQNFFQYTPTFRKNFKKEQKQKRLSLDYCSADEPSIPLT